jgi:hypothetical protein
VVRLGFGGSGFDRLDDHFGLAAIRAAIWAVVWAAIWANRQVDGGPVGLVVDAAEAFARGAFACGAKGLIVGAAEDTHRRCCRTQFFGCLGGYRRERVSVCPSPEDSAKLVKISVQVGR